MFLSDNVDSKGIVKLSLKEIANAIGENKMWVSRHLNALENVKLIHKEMLRDSVTGIKTYKYGITPLISIICNMTDSDVVLRGSVTEEFNKIWKLYRRDGSKGNKASAYKNYLKLSKKDREDMASSLKYFMAFTLPKYRPMMPKFIKEKTWQYPREFNGKVIPMNEYRIADVEAFKGWFNKAVAGTDIPQVAEVTPERHVNLNIAIRSILIL